MLKERRGLYLPVVVVMGLLIGVGGYVLADTVVSITIAPSTLVLSAQPASWVTVHTNLPYGAVDSASVEMNGVPIAWSKADDRGNFVAKFRMGEIKGIVTPPSAELTLSGVLKDGTPFEASDTVSVRP